MEADTNVNLVKCIVEKNHIGYDTMVNFCTGKQVRVDWVPMDWVGAGFLTLILLALIAMLVAVAVMLMTDPY